LARLRRSALLHPAISLIAGPARAAVVLIVLVALVLWGSPPLLTAAGNFLMVEDHPSAADAIVVLSGDGGARLEQGIQLYRDGYAPLLILAGGGQQGSPSAAEVMRQQALDMGIPDSAILMVTQSGSTREDALYTRELMLRHRLKSAILVTSPYHQRRASLTFARALDGTGIRVSSYPVQDDRWQPNSWWLDGTTLRLTLLETAKLAYYYLRGYL